MNNLTPYIPSTIIGLIGLLFGYLYYYFRNKDDKRLEEIKVTKASDRIKAIEANLNHLGVHVDTSTLNPKQKYDLLLQTLKAKTRKYLIIATTTILLSLIIALLIWQSTRVTQKDTDNKVDIHCEEMKKEIDSLTDVAKSKLSRLPFSDKTFNSKTDLETSILVLEQIRIQLEVPNCDKLKNDSSITRDIGRVVKMINSAK